MRWALVERHGPSIESGHGNWNEMDAIVEAADDHGVKLLPIIGFTPEWASAGGDLWEYPDAEPFEDFVAAALERYPQITAWELWNEPNFARFSKPQPSPAAFVEMLRSARRARDSVGSNAKLIAGGVAPGGEIDVHSWLNEVAMRGGLNFVDGLGVHPYSPAEPDDPRSWLMQLEALHFRLAQLGKPDMPLWLTEYGAPTMRVATGYAPPLTEAQQADRLRRAYALATRFDWIHNLTWYEYRDSCDDAGDPECRFGLVRTDMSPRPAYTAMRQVVAGSIARLRPRLELTSRIQLGSGLQPARRPVARSAGHGRRAATRRRANWRAVARPTLNRVTVTGKLMLPGSPAPDTLVTLLLPMTQGPPRAVAVVVKHGVFVARFQGNALRSGTIGAHFGGSNAYEPVTIQAQIAASTARVGGGHALHLSSATTRR
jgi:polysaccharide biosynthesis protein PslG